MRSILGRSVEGRELTVYWNFPSVPASPASGSSSSLTLLIGGTHGDESATVPILENFIRAYLESGKVTGPTAVISLLNPDGFARTTRYNARGVDLNRNFPHNWNPESEEPSGIAPLSEPEARCLYDFIVTHRPRKIVSLHWALAELDADGSHSVGLAQGMWDSLSPEERKPYRLRLPEPGKPDAGVCTGSLGQWCGHGLLYPDNRRPAMITLELPHHPHSRARAESLSDDHLEIVRNHWDSRPDEYLAGVEATVHRLLETACGFDADAGSRSPGIPPSR